MRALFLLLLLANLAFFAWSRYLAPHPVGTDPRPLAQQIDPGALRILTPAALAAMAPSKPKPASAAAAGAPTAAPAAPAATTPATALAAPLVCMEWGAVPPGDATRAAQALAPLGLGSRLSQRTASGAQSWWVFIPPQPSLQGAQRKAAELKALGVDDYFIVQDQGPERWAISLGVFRSEAAAQARLEALRAKKVHSAQAGPRASQGEQLWYVVSEVDPTLRARLQQIAQDFPGTELRECESAAPSN
ncbi:MAG TPA: SPOR domain-containing protein [Burkholderiales bacterium]|nr:SPOR domain-containing protein [Burkholderiales bacterium]